MQISNPSLSQFIGSTLDRKQQTDRFPVKPVTIEGQIVEEDDRKKPAQAFVPADRFVQDLGYETAQQLIKPISNPDNVRDSLLIENNPKNNPELLATSEQGITAEPSPAEYSFPFGNRRSFNGLAGGSLVIQNYLNNEPLTHSQSGSLSNRIDLFI